MEPDPGKLSTLFPPSLDRQIYVCGAAIIVLGQMISKTDATRCLVYNCEPPFVASQCREKLRKLRNEGLFTPPSERGSILYPYTAGGANWSGGSFDPASGILYVPVTNLASQSNRIGNRRATIEGWAD